MKSILSLFLLLAFSDLTACSCGSFSKLNKADITKTTNIFIGKVVSIESYDNRSRKVIFQITENLKTDSSTKITLLTGFGGADCGLLIEEGQVWYIFSDYFQGNLWATLCGRSALLSEHSIIKETDYRKYYRIAMRKYNKDKTRAKREIRFIHKIVN